MTCWLSIDGLSDFHRRIGHQPESTSPVLAWMNEVLREDESWLSTRVVEVYHTYVDSQERPFHNPI